MKKFLYYVKRSFQIFNQMEMRVLPGNVAFFFILAIIPIVNMIIFLVSKFSISVYSVTRLLGRFLPSDIKVIKSIEVSRDFSARFNVVNKTYRYITYLSDVDLPYYNNRALRLYGNYNIDAMSKASEYLVGTHDFAAFKKSDTEYETTVRTINSANVFVNGKEIVFEINGDGFMHNMIRIIVGTLLDIGREKKTPEYILELIKSKSRIMAGKTVIPDGLYLKEIFTTLDK